MIFLCKIYEIKKKRMYVCECKTFSSEYIFSKNKNMYHITRCHLNLVLESYHYSVKKNYSKYSESKELGKDRMKMFFLIFCEVL